MPVWRCPDRLDLDYIPKGAPTRFCYSRVPSGSPLSGGCVKPSHDSPYPENARDDRPETDGNAGSSRYVTEISETGRLAKLLNLPIAHITKLVLELLFVSDCACRKFRTCSTSTTYIKAILSRNLLNLFALQQFHRTLTDSNNFKEKNKLLAEHG